MFSPPHFDPHFEVAAYALGVLDPADSEAFENHLIDCMECQSELLELHEVPAALDVIKGISSPAPPRRNTGEAAVATLLDRVAMRRRKRTRGLWLAAAAAITVTALSPIVVRQVWPAQPDQQTATQTFTASSPDRHVQAEVALAPKAWGTEVSFQLSGVTGPLRCTLVAVSRSGETETVMSWQVKKGQGFGVTSQPDPLQLKGGTSFDESSIKRFEFRTSNGPDLLDVPATT
jgi:anti-sigma factor RsiW